MIIRECQNHDPPFASFLQLLDPLENFALAIDDDLVPGRRLFLNRFPVAKPAHVSEVRCDEIQTVFHLPGPRHPIVIRESESDAMLPQQVKKGWVEPLLIPNLKGEFVS